MAQRRMFSLTVVDTDKFLDMPCSAQSLYFHLGMRADDEGFVSSPRKITKLVGSADDDLKLLTMKGFIIPFESGVCVITDWKQNNYIPKDRFHPSIYTAEKLLLSTLENDSYTACMQDVSSLDTEVRLGKDSIGKVSKEKKGSVSRFSPPTVDEVKAYCLERGNSIDPEQFVDFYTSKGWTIGTGKMKDWKAAVRNWEKRDISRAPQPDKPTEDRSSYQWEDGDAF